MLSRVGTGEFEIAVSVSLLLEYEDVLLRHLPDSALDEDDVRDLLDYICSVAMHQQIFYLWRPFLGDPGDDLVLELAVSACCHAIVTHNVRDFHGARELGVRVLTPGEFLKWVH